MTSSLLALAAPIDLVFAPDAALNAMLLIELTESELQAIVGSIDHGYEFRGTPDQSAVLVDHTRTLAVKIVETSNTALIVHHGHTNIGSGEGDGGDDSVITIEGAVSHHLELTETNPSFDALRSKLLESPLTADTDTDTDIGASAGMGSQAVSTLTMDEMRQLCQCSDSQLCAAIHALSIVPFNDAHTHYCMLDPHYHSMIVDQCLNAMVEHGVPWTAIDGPMIARSLVSLFPYHLTLAVIVRLCDTEPLSLTQPLAWSPSRLCQLLSLALFAESPSWPQTEFEAALKTKLPTNPPLAFDQSNFAGFALLTGAAPRQWQYYSVLSLHGNLAKRLSQLFAQRSRWLLEELRPYVSDLVSPNEKLDAVLLKQCRILTELNAQGQKSNYYAKR